MREDDTGDDKEYGMRKHDIVDMREDVCHRSNASDLVSLHKGQFVG